MSSPTSMKAYRLYACTSRIAMLLALASCAAPSAPPAVSSTQAAPTASTRMLSVELADLAEGQPVNGFVTRALYVDDDGRARGARFVHAHTGFVLDYLAIESAPQTMVYATTFPAGNGGEPHTQEHLILGKGNKGRWLGNVRHASFAEWNAFTGEHRTVFAFNTTAGPDSFWRVWRANLDALLNPDYSDEEIRREVRNFGVTKEPDGSLAIDERGTVYNEQVASFETPETEQWYELARLLYGDGHPLANCPGGTPDGIRTLTPEKIRAFHAAHYRLGNMGAIGAFPSSLALGTVLTHISETLDSLATSKVSHEEPLSEATLPAFRPAPLGAVRVVEYPYATGDHPSRAMLAWPATRKLDFDERTTMESFLDAFADGEGSTLYRAIVDDASRVIDIGATKVWIWTRADHGQPLYVGVEGVSATHADEPSMRALRDVVHRQLEAIAALPDGSKELGAFNDRVKARIIERLRKDQKRLDTPPEFTARKPDEDWIDSLDDLARSPGFRKSLTHEAPLRKALALTDPSKNAWRDRIRVWGLFDTPYVVAARPSPALRARLDAERSARVGAELTRLEARYGTQNAQEALTKREADIARASEILAKDEANVPLAPLALDPPMTFDDALNWRRQTHAGVTHVAATFDAMKSVTVGVNLKFDSLSEESLPWLGVLPSLISDVGVIRDGVPIPYDDVQDRLRREVLGVDVYYSTRMATGRAELALQASGNDVEEAKRALGWIRTLLATPDWRPENLPRIRDVLDETLTRLHATMSSPEESWLNGVAQSYRYQDRELALHSASALTRVHDAFLTSWRLQGGDGAKGMAPFLMSLAGASKRLDRASLAALAAALASTEMKATDPRLAPWVRAARALPKDALSRVRKAGRDLGQLMIDLPDSSLAGDWGDLCREMAKGVARPPSEGLDALRKTLASIRHVENARTWVVGSSEHQAAIEADITETINSLDASPAPTGTRATRPRVLDRARARGGVTADSLFIALVNPNASNVSIAYTAPSARYDDTGEGELLDYLAVNVFGGEGTQSFFKRVWGTGLAYNASVAAWSNLGLKEFYADGCSDLPELLRFADAEVRRAPIDERFVDYAIVPGFGSRAADTFEARAEAMASDVAEDHAPDRERAFRARLLALRQRPDLAAEMQKRAIPAMSALIPSLVPAASPPKGALYFTVGPEPRLANDEREMQHALGPGVKVIRIWPRDFWDVGVPCSDVERAAADRLDVSMLIQPSSCSGRLLQWRLRVTSIIRRVAPDAVGSKLHRP